MIEYRDDPVLAEAEVLGLYRDVGWTEYLRDGAAFFRGIAKSLALIAAFDTESQSLIGLVRVLGDGETVILIQDLVLCREYQGRGIGKELLGRILRRYAGVRQKLVVCDDEAAVEAFYAACGFKEASDCGIRCLLRFDAETGKTDGGPPAKAEMPERPVSAAKKGVFCLRRDERPREGDILELRRKLQDFNRPFLEIDKEEGFLITTRDAAGELVGGVACTTVGQWLEIDYLWVAEKERGRGLGGILVEEAESMGRHLGCTRASLNTFSFQARPFYEKKGYSTVHVQANYPLTNARYFMEKRFFDDRAGSEGSDGLPSQGSSPVARGLL